MTTCAALGSTSGVRPAVSSKRLGSSAASTHWPSREMPIGRTSYLLRSMARSTPAAVAQETACSEERPPKTMATRGRLGWSGWGWSVVISRDSIPTREGRSYAGTGATEADSQHLHVETFVVAAGGPHPPPRPAADLPGGAASTDAPGG